jgi:hypothetical protein
VAASAAIAAGAATAATELAKPQQPPVHDVASGVNPQTRVAAVVDYAPTPWDGTEMRVQVSGIQPGTHCKFLINGHTFVTSWTVRAPYGQKAWYTAYSAVRASTVHSFQITSGTRMLINIPVT